MKIEIPFSSNTLDQIFLSQCGGNIALKPNGVVFQFDNQEQYQQYKKLKEENHESVTRN